MAIRCARIIRSENPSMDVGLLTLQSVHPYPVPLTQEDLKRIAAYKAVEYLESGMVLGLSTGSTAKRAVEKIGLLRRGKLTNTVGIPTSKITHEQTLSVANLIVNWMELFK